jgi:hypothetical protein
VDAEVEEVVTVPTLDTLDRLAAQGPACPGPNLRWERPTLLVVLLVFAVLLSLVGGAEIPGEVAPPSPGQIEVTETP